MTDRLPPRDELLALFDRQVRGGSDGAADGAPSEPDGPITRITFPSTGFIAAPADTGKRGAELDALIGRQRDHFAARGLPVEWKTYAYDAPADLVDRLVAAGFEAGERETLVIGSVDTLAATTPQVAGVAFRETTAASDLSAIGELHTEIWGEDWTWIVEDLRRRIDAVGPDGIRILVAEADGGLVSAAWLVMRAGSDFAGLWGGSTLEAWRGRGIYRALVARRAKIARDAGYRFLQVDASDNSRPILERLGFVALTTTTPYVHRLR